MAKKFNCDCTKRQPEERGVCEWCAAGWRRQLDEIAKIIETAGERYTKYHLLTLGFPPGMELTLEELKAIYKITCK